MNIMMLPGRQGEGKGGGGSTRDELKPESLLLQMTVIVLCIRVLLPDSQSTQLQPFLTCPHSHFVKTKCFSHYIDWEAEALRGLPRFSDLW